MAVRRIHSIADGPPGHGDWKKLRGGGSSTNSSTSSSSMAVRRIHSIADGTTVHMCDWKKLRGPAAHTAAAAVVHSENKHTRRPPEHA
jgi:hypothetical protein